MLLLEYSISYKEHNFTGFNHQRKRYSLDEVLYNRSQELELEKT